jgi:hypothetical protein
MIDKNGETVYILKIRGITMDMANSLALQFEHFRRMVLSIGREQEAAKFNYQKIRPTRDSKIVTRPLVKKYLPVCQKGIITDALDVLPFGYE